MDGAGPGVPNGQDSGVETEGDQESNDSSLSSVSLGNNPNPPVQSPPIAATSSMSSSNSNNEFPAIPTSPQVSNRTTPEPVANFAHPGANNLQPPASVTEDGYLGDCSSDGGNEKNFPMPAHLLKRLVKNGTKSCPCHPEQLQPISQNNLQDAATGSAMNFGAAGSSGGSETAVFEAVEPPAGLSFMNLSPSRGLNGPQLGKI